jgi:SAM-dependent methyltransferase
LAAQPDPFPLFLKALEAVDYARSRKIPGLAFDDFGRTLGRKLFLAGVRGATQYLLTPVNIVRYWEFPFTWACLPPGDGDFLDMSSPRLFDLFVATHRPAARITVMNPDARDLAQTAQIANAMNLSNIICREQTVESLAHTPNAYDCIWSVSVIEHISGKYDDSQAIRWIYDALKPAGRLILTFPVDRKLVIETRDTDYYGTQEPLANGQYFFYRRYDLDAVHERLLKPIGRQPDVMRFFGETTPGRYLEYEQRWIQHGFAVTVDDPREIADHYREYDRWEDMPGLGICGVMFTKPG